MSTHPKESSDVQNGNSHVLAPQAGGKKKPYDHDDYSQKAINQGQRIINYQLTEATKKLEEAVKELRKAVSKVPGVDKNDLTAADNAVSAAEAISSTVADIRPPGCERPLE